MTLYSATMTVDQIDVGKASVSVTGPHARKRLRTSYAARFGAQRREDAGGAQRNRKLQSAFNSPFWPFVLCSTSIGQEGLDFHYYCHAVVHWNVPSNPVDLEQREGRVHRYKGHAVRKNVVDRFGLPNQKDPSSDPWPALFRAAAEELKKNDGGLTPFWLYVTPGGARIERHVPAVPLSLDRARADALRRSLAVYRMAFGQARQEDVVAFLQRFPADQLAAVSDDLRINLAPRRVTHAPEAAGEIAVTSVALTDDDLAPVWADVPDEPPDVHFGAIEGLLDEFAAHGGTTAKTAVAPVARVDNLHSLLSEFAALTPSGTHVSAQANSLDAMQKLLDSFADLRSRTPASR
jgi:hypothetical protein